MPGGDLPEAVVEGEHVLRPGQLDDLEAFLERLAVEPVHLLAVARDHCMQAGQVLPQHVHPPALEAAREAGDRPSARHAIEHGDVLRHAERIARRQHDAELADPHALRPHRDVEIEEHRVVRDLEPLDVEVVLGEHVASLSARFVVAEGRGSSPPAGGGVAAGSVGGHREVQPRPATSRAAAATAKNSSA